MLRSKRNSKFRPRLPGEPPSTIKNLQWLLDASNWRSHWNVIAPGLLLLLSAPIAYHYLLREKTPVPLVPAPAAPAVQATVAPQPELRPILTVAGQNVNLNIFTPDMFSFADDETLKIHETYELTFDVRNNGLVPALSLNADVNCQWHISTDDAKPFPKVAPQVAPSALNLGVGEHHLFTEVADRYYRETPDGRKWESVTCILTIDMLDSANLRHRNQTCWRTDKPLRSSGDIVVLYPCSSEVPSLKLENS
jgi:hypothetical protein